MQISTNSTLWINLIVCEVVFVDIYVYIKNTAKNIIFVGKQQ